MTMIEQQIKTLIEVKAGMTISDLDQNLRNGLGLDSLDIVELFIDIDREFDVCIPDSIWEAANVITVRDMTATVVDFLHQLPQGTKRIVYE